MQSGYGSHENQDIKSIENMLRSSVTPTIYELHYPDGIPPLLLNVKPYIRKGLALDKLQFQCNACTAAAQTYTHKNWLRRTSVIANTFPI